MNRFLCFLLGSALLIVPAFATLDSSPGECAARYGAGTPVKNGVPLQPPTIKTNTVVYKQGAFTIMVR